MMKNRNKYIAAFLFTILFAVLIAGTLFWVNDGAEQMGQVERITNLLPFSIIVLCGAGYAIARGIGALVSRLRSNART